MYKVAGMYKVLTVVCVIAILSLGASVISAVVQRSETGRESKQVAAISHDVKTIRHDLAELRAELHLKTGANAVEHFGAEHAAHHHK